MTVSSTRAGELALEAQEVLLAEQEHETHETPRLCSPHLRGTASKSLLALTLVWLTACFMTVILLKLDWQILLKCLPGCLFGLSSVLMFSYGEKQYDHGDSTDTVLPVCAILALPQVCWLLLLPLCAMPWQSFTLEVVGTALGLLGLHVWMHSEGEEEDWEKAGFFLQLIGLLVTWLGALPCLVQITWQVALCSLPFIGFLLFFVLVACTEGDPGYLPLRVIEMSALLLLYGMSLPMSGMWQWFLFLELQGYLYLYIFVFDEIWLERAENPEMIIACGLCLCALPFGAFALITKLSCNLTAPLCKFWWPWVLFTPCALVTMYCGVEAVFLIQNRHELKAARVAILTRLLVIGALGLAPVVLATDVEGWQRGVEAPDMNPTTYLNVSLPVSLQNWSHVSMEIQEKQLHWLHMPRPLWPSKDDLASASTTTRSTFWLSYMGLKFMLASGMVLLMLGLNCKWSTGASPDPSMEGQPLTAETKLEEEALTAEVELEEGKEEEREETMSFQDRHRLVMLSVIVPIHLTVVIKLSCAAASFGQLTPNTGLAYEGYDLCLTSGLVWIVAQALAVRAADFAAHYSAADVASTMLIVVPFLGDGFDCLKDAMLGALALRSQRMWLRCLGLAALSYLVILYGFLVRSSSNRLELQKSYLPVLFLLKRTPAPRDPAAADRTVRDTFCRTLLDGVWRKLLVQLYKQSTPSRQSALILEDTPQGVLALLVSLADGFQTFTVVVNIGVPVLRITLAWWLHHRIAWKVADWLLQEALNAAEAQQVAVCDEFVASLHRLQDTFPDYDLWEHLKGKNAGCREAATRKVQQPQSHVGLRLFVLLQQVVTEDEEESTAERWKKVTELSKKCTVEQIQAAMGSIRKAALHLEPSELVLDCDADSENSLKWVAARTVLEAIPKPEKVTRLHLELTLNSLGPGGARAVGEAVAKFQQITNFRLHYNNFGGNGAKAVGDSLAKLEQITDLEIHFNYNNIGTEGAKAVGDSLAKLQQITNLTLLLKYQCIGAEGAKAVGDSLAKLEQITNLKLVLTSNHIGAEGAKAVGDSLAKLEQITDLELWLNSNEIGAEGAKAVGDSLAKLEQITNVELHLDANDIGAEGAKALGDSLAKLEQITNLELHGVPDEVVDEIRHQLEKPGRTVNVTN